MFKVPRNQIPLYSPFSKGEALLNGLFTYLISLKQFPLFGKQGLGEIYRRPCDCDYSLTF